MGGFRHRSLHVKMKYRFRTGRTLLGQPPPAGIAHARRAVAYGAVADKIDVNVVFVGRPMPLKIVEEGGPVGLKVMRFEIAKRERKPVVDPDERGGILGEAFNQPVGDALSRPVFSRGWWRQALDRRCLAFSRVDAQALQACGWGLRS